MIGERVIHPNAGNWVDRGDPPGPVLARTLQHVLGRGHTLDDEALLRHAGIILDMVDADVSEVQVMGYLGDIQDEIGIPRSPGHERRLAAVSLWHIAKAALVRDRALRLLESAPPPEQPRLSEWLKERILAATGDDGADGKPQP